MNAAQNQGLNRTLLGELFSDDIGASIFLVNKFCGSAASAIAFGNAAQTAE
jgi:hypothetical protein